MNSTHSGSSSACARTVGGRIECWGELVDDTPRQERADSGFHITGIAWDMALRDWSTPGLCLSAMDPFAFWRNEDIERTSTTRIQGAGAFELPDVEPVTDFGVMYLVEDCDGVQDVVPTAAGIMASMYEDKGAGDTVGGAFAISFDRAMLDAWTEDLYAVGYRGGDIASRGGNFIVVVDQDGRFVEDATVTCNGRACPDTYYLDLDASMALRSGRHRECGHGLGAGYRGAGARLADADVRGRAPDPRVRALRDGEPPRHHDGVHVRGALNHGRRAAHCSVVTPSMQVYFWSAG